MVVVLGTAILPLDRTLPRRERFVVVMLFGASRTTMVVSCVASTLSGCGADAVHYSYSDPLVEPAQSCLEVLLDERKNDEVSYLDGDAPIFSFDVENDCSATFSLDEEVVPSFTLAPGEHGGFLVDSPPAVTMDGDTARASFAATLDSLSLTIRATAERIEED